MNKFFKVLEYIILALGIIIISGILLSGCDIVKCYPEFDMDGSYIGINCGGEF